MSELDDKRLAEIRKLLPQLKEERTSVFCKAVTHREKIWLAEEAIKHLLSRVAAPKVDDDDQPCPDPRCNDHLGAMPMPQCVTAVAWAEESDKLRTALSDLLNVIAADDLIPESVSYMKRARSICSRGVVIGSTLNPQGGVIAALVSALEVAINTVECDSLDKDGNELPWYKGAKKALALARAVAAPIEDKEEEVYDAGYEAFCQEENEL